MTYKKKLIEVALPLAAISDAGAHEQSIKRGKPTQLHKWWAGRPLVSCRAILWASLIDDPSSHPDRFPTLADQDTERKRLFGILERLATWENSNDQDVLGEARREIEVAFPDGAPPVVDPFGGGGAIPLEARRLGLDTIAGDLNPVSVLLQRALIEIPDHFRGLQPVHIAARHERMTWQRAEGIAADVAAYGEWMCDRAMERIGHHYPPVTLEDGTTATPIAWIWARTVKSPDPSWPGHVPLVKSWVLAKKPGKPIVWIEPIVDHDTHTIRYEIRTGGTPPPATVERGNGICVATGTSIPGAYIKAEAISGRLQAAMLAIVADGERGRCFAGPMTTSSALDFATLNIDFLKTSLPQGGLGFRVQPYGIDEWWKLFSARQLLGLTTLCDLLVEVRSLVEADAAEAGLPEDNHRLHEGGRGASAYADAVVTYLAFAIDRVADWNNTCCRWDSTNVVNQQLFNRQSIPMMWDYCEIVPHGSAAGSMRASLKTMRVALETLPAMDSGTARVTQRDARSLANDQSEVLFSTDPPYYDNVGYADLSDFFYVWLRRNLSSVWPDEFATLVTPKSEELIADSSRAGSKVAATQHFESGMREFMDAVAKAQHPELPATLYYAFKASETTADGSRSTGWATFLQGILDARMAVTATWPIRTENKSRMRALGSNALASSIVLACRPRAVTAPLATRGEFLAALRNELPPAIRLLQVENIAPVDMAQSAIGPGIAVFSRYSKVVEADGAPMTVHTALQLINEVLAETLSGEEAEFDADTRFALTWFEQYGHNPGPFGDADLLAKAKNTSVEGVREAGVVASRDGKVRLVERTELPDHWDPTTDDRLTVWETTQHLIRALDTSETTAADLLRRLGAGMSDRARQLAYLLYGICDRKKWAEDAGAYNMLVTAWPELTRLAATEPTPTDNRSLF